MKKIISLLFLTGSLCAQIFKVTVTEDVFDGKCDKKCSLREAIIAANENPGKDIVKIPAGTYRLTIEGRKDVASLKGDLNINDDLIIEGEGKDKTVIVSSNEDRIFFIDPYAKGLKVTISGLTIKGGKSDFGGGILNKGELVLKNVKIERNEANLGGGVLSDRSMEMFNCEIVSNKASTTGNTSDGFGGGIYFKGRFFAKNSLFRNNISDRDGGALYQKEDSDLTLLNSQFLSNKSNASGGAIRLNSKSVIESVVFEKNEANDGGAVAIFPKGDAYFLNASFTQNQAFGKNLGGGGAIFNYKGKLNIEKSRFNKNQAFGEGGGAIENTGRMKISDASFSQNRALKYDDPNLPSNTSLGLGGALLLIKGSVNELFNAIFSENEAYINGGAIYNDDQALLSIEDSLFTKNKALQNFGGAVLNDGNLTIKRSRFEKNEAKLLGGAIALIKNSLSCIDTEFTENKSYENAGVFYESDKASEAVFKNCRLTSNEASKFAGAILSKSKLSLLFATVSKNKAPKGGGGIFVDKGSETVIDRSFINENFTEENGGGVLNRGTLTVKNSLVSSNEASKIGGGIFALENETFIENSLLSYNFSHDGGAAAVYENSYLSVKNSTFKENRAQYFAGAILNAKGLVVAENSTFYKNEAKIGGAFSNNQKESKLHLLHITVTDNDAEQNSGALYNYEGEIEIGNSLFKDPCLNQGTISSKGGNLERGNGCGFSLQSDENSVEDILIETPKQNGGRVETAALKENSPAIGNGETDICAQKDERGEKRENCDSGAYEKSYPSSISLKLEYKLKDLNKNGKADKNDIVSITATVLNDGENDVHDLTLENPMVEGARFSEGDFIKKQKESLTKGETVAFSYEMKIVSPYERDISFQALSFGSNAPLVKSNVLKIHIYDGDPLRAFVKRFYKLILGREADENGLNYWITIIKTSSAAKAALGFLSSKEFENKNLTDEEFLEILYKTFFDREADEEGLHFWLNYLNDRSREEVIKNFIKSEEFKKLSEKFGVRAYNDGDFGYYEEGLKGFISRFYLLVLGRGVDEEGLEYWSDQITNGEKTPTEVAIGFFESNEYKSKNQNDTQFVKTLYKVFFNREADEKGLNYWLNELKNKSRIEIIKSFATTQEFKNLIESFGI